ncbi:MAG: DedA family protein [Pseudomonadales bacterium]
MIIDDYVFDWLSANKQHSWMIIPMLAFLEACPGVGLFVSGVILLSVSTLLYTENLVTLPQILALAFVAASLADHVGFYLGRWFGPKLQHTTFVKKRAAQVQKGEAFILKYGAAAIVFGRLLTAVRSLVPMLVGVSGTSPLKYTLLDLLACAIWSAGLGLLITGLGNFLAL